jgi:phosphoesterase RecJ-like protein
MIWTDLTKLIAENNSFLISSHVSHDADNIGSQLSFYWYLNSLGKEVEIFNVDDVPRKFNFYKNIDKVGNVAPTKKYDVFVMLDSSTQYRSGWDDVDACSKYMIDIDHHRDNTLFGTVSCVDTSAAATCQIVYRFFNENNIDFPLYVAEALYGGILADTGGFQFDNTSKEIFEIAAALSERGVDTARVYKKLFASNTIAGLTARSQISSSLTFYENKKVGIVTMEEGLLEKLGADRGDIEGMSDLGLKAEGVEVSAFAKQVGNDVRFSLRSAGAVDVGAIAATFDGGGGHRAAAGCTHENSTLEKALPLLLEKIRKVLP